MHRWLASRSTVLLFIGLLVYCGFCIPVTNAQTRVDILVLYTSEARDAAGGTSGIMSRIDAAITQSNQSFANSNAGMYLHLAHAQEFAFTESTSMETMLQAIRANTSAQTLRNQHGADLVALLTGGTNTGGIAGIAYLMSPPTSNFAPWAYSVTRQDQALFHTFAHEVGHNLGCHHDPNNTGGQSGAYDYSFGHRFTAGGTQYRTVMAYAPGTRISHFSNPSINFNGVATGTTTRDNARTIRNTRGIVSDFRDEVSTFWFRAVALDNRVMLRWSPPTESGFLTDLVRIRDDTNTYPEDPDGGPVVYEGSETSYLHTDLAPGIPRYYTIWTHDGAGWVAP